MGDAVILRIIRRRGGYIPARCAFFEVLAYALPPQRVVRRRGISVGGGGDDATDIRLGPFRRGGRLQALEKRRLPFARRPGAERPIGAEALIAESVSSGGGDGVRPFDGQSAFGWRPGLSF